MSYLYKSLFCFLLLASFKVQAQTSLMEEVSYPYLNKLIKIAKEQYPREKINLKRIQMAETNVQKARLSWFEVLGLYVIYNPYNKTPLTDPRFLGGIFNGTQLGISFNVGSIFQKPSLIKTARDELSISKLQSSEYDLNIEANVKDRYFKYIEQVTIVKAKARSVLDVGIMVNTIRNKFEKGEETFENYSKALILYNDQNQLKITSESAMLSAKAALEELLNNKLEDIK